MLERQGRTPRRMLVAAAALLALPACTAISSRDNAALAVALARPQQVAASWRRDPAAEREADARVQQLLQGGLTAEKAIAICFLAHPDVQVVFETLEVSRSELVAAVTPPNPVAIAGMRQPGGNLSAFFPDRSMTVGVLQNVLGLVNLPSRRRIAGRELERARIEAADRLVDLAAQVNEAYINHAAALAIEDLRRRALTTAWGVLDVLRQQVQAARGSEDELLGERASVLQAEAAAARASLDVVTTRARLAQLTGLAGRRDDWTLAVGLPPLPGTDPDPAQLEQSALDRRLDVQAARKAVETRLDAAGVQRRWRWLGAAELGVFRESASGGPHFTGPNVLLELPLFDQRQAQILSADSEARSALRRVESLFLTARGEIRTHAAELATTRQLIGRYDAELLPALRRLVEVQGPGTVDGRRAELAVLGTEEERAGLLRDYWRARGALGRAAGDFHGMPEWPTMTQNGAVPP